MEMSWNYLAAGRKDLCTGHGLLWRGGQAIKDLSTGQCYNLCKRSILATVEFTVNVANYVNKYTCNLAWRSGIKSCIPAIAGRHIYIAYEVLWCAG